jgi:hypothetical protein
VVFFSVLWPDKRFSSLQIFRHWNFSCSVMFHACKMFIFGRCWFESRPEHRSLYTDETRAEIVPTLATIAPYTSFPVRHSI